MRKPRDPSASLRSAYDAELKAPDEKARRLKSRRIVQLGELVIACAGDTLPIEQLAGVLLDAVESTDAAAKEVWRTRGSAFFQAKGRVAKRGAGDDRRASSSDGGSATT